MNFRQGENLYLLLCMEMEIWQNIKWRYSARKRDMLYLPIFEAIETEERPYIILREITNILEGFRHLQTCRRLGLKLIKSPHSNLLY